jgi:hypothetical protein
MQTNNRLLQTPTEQIAQFVQFTTPSSPPLLVCLLLFNLRSQRPQLFAIIP